MRILDATVPQIGAWHYYYYYYYISRSWAQLIKRIYEVDPLVCPSCGAEMKLIAFITEHEVVD